MIHNSTLNMICGKGLYSEKIVDGIPYTFVKTRDYHGNGFDRIYNLIEFPFKIWKVCKKFSCPDIIYTSSPDIFTAFSALLLAKAKQIKCIVEIRDLWPESIVEYTKWTRNNPVIKLLYKLEKWIYKNADTLIFTMPGGKDYIAERYPNLINTFGKNKIYNINNGVDLTEFDYNKTHCYIDDEDLLAPNTFKVVYTGAIRKVNNLQQLIDCAQLLLKYEDIIFLIYGTGNEVEALKNYVKENQIKNVKFKGRLEKKYIPFILSHSDLNVVNVKKSNINRFGCSWNKLYEYFASAKPVLANQSVKYDLITKYNCGISRNMASSSEYMHWILYFYNLDENSYKTFCNNARQTANLFDYKNLSDELETIFNTLVNTDKGDLS